MEYKSVRLDKDTYDALAQLAEKNNRTIVGQIREMLGYYKIIAPMIKTVPLNPRTTSSRGK